MSGAGSALMGIGSARGEGRAVQAAQKAINSPLLEASMEGAHGVLLSIAGGSDLGLFEINESASLVQEAAHPDANIIFGTVIDDSLGDEVRVTVIAAGFDSGGPTHKKLEPTALSSPPRTATGPHRHRYRCSAHVAAAGRTDASACVHAPPPVQAPVQHAQVRSLRFVLLRRRTVPPQPSPSQGNGYVPSVPRSLSPNGSLPSRPVPVTEDPDDEVDVPPFMRR